MIFEDSDIKINPGCAVFVTTESLVVITGLPRNSHRVRFHCNYTTLLLPKRVYVLKLNLNPYLKSVAF